MGGHCFSLASCRHTGCPAETAYAAVLQEKWGTQTCTDLAPHLSSHCFPWKVRPGSKENQTVPPPLEGFIVWPLSQHSSVCGFLLGLALFYCFSLSFGRTHSRNSCALSKYCQSPACHIGVQSFAKR